MHWLCWEDNAVSAYLLLRREAEIQLQLQLGLGLVHSLLLDILDRHRHSCAWPQPDACSLRGQALKAIARASPGLLAG